MVELYFRGLLADLQARRDERKHSDAGLMLLDVLLAMAIFSLLLIIAISALGSMRRRALEANKTESVIDDTVAKSSTGTGGTSSTDPYLNDTGTVDPSVSYHGSVLPYLAMGVGVVLVVAAVVFIIVKFKNRTPVK